MNINLSCVSFKAQITRNWDGVCSETKAQSMASYDEAIAKIEQKRAQAMEVDSFIHSKEVQPLIASLPKKDLVNIKHPFCIDDINSSETKPTLEYVLQDSNSAKRAFYSSINPQQLNTLRFNDTFKQDNTLNKEGIIGWLKYLNDYFVAKK